MEWIERDETKDRNKVIIIDVGIKVDERGGEGGEKNQETGRCRC